MVKPWLKKPSNRTQEASKDPSKSEPTPGITPANILFARLRRLEQRLDKAEAKLSVVQRDCWRIEKKTITSTEALPNHNGEKPVETLMAGLFG